MRSWFLLSIALTAAVVASWFHRTAPSMDAAPVNPMLWASDDWTVWTQWNREEAASRCGLDDLPETEWVRVFSSAEAEVWHAEAQWPVLPEGWAQQSWRGGWLCGTPLALEMWRAQPGEMSQHWREGESGATLMRTEYGWALKSDGWVVWKDTTQERLSERWLRCRCWPRRVPTFRRLGGLDKVGTHPRQPRRWRRCFGMPEYHCPIGERDGLMAVDGPSKIPISGGMTSTLWPRQTTGLCCGRTNRWL